MEDLASSKFQCWKKIGKITAKLTKKTKLHLAILLQQKHTLINKYRYVCTFTQWAPIKPQQLHKSLCNASIQVLFFFFFVCVAQLNALKHPCVHFTFIYWPGKKMRNSENNTCHRNGRNISFDFYSTEHCPCERIFIFNQNHINRHMHWTMNNFTWIHYLLQAFFFLIVHWF